jgi:hypothetical protein
MDIPRTNELRSPLAGIVKLHMKMLEGCIYFFPKDSWSLIYHGVATRRRFMLCLA